ncbi:putative phage head-tail adaptor [Afipia felis]|uniref:Phage head-tail adaptor n=1 Tax=Afipia felis TaxID=1035 RepID=A0A090N842_AFIFE|nr:phage head closure protein [Afipia felis]CEG09483.1 putative phage head-tail adaptor [Afipia felis]
MRAGKMDKSITLQRYTRVVDEGGGSILTWTALVTLRAQIIQASTEEFIRSYGASDETIVIFRTRYFDDVKTADRIVYDGVNHNIKEIKEIGRGRGLDIRTVAIQSEQ